MKHALSDYAATVVGLWWACPSLTILVLCGLWLHYDWDHQHLDVAIGCLLLVLVASPWVILLLAILVRRLRKVP